MSALLCLPVLGGTVVMLFVLALAARRLPAGSVPAATVALCLLAAAGLCIAIASQLHAQIAIPAGLGLFPARLALDPLSAFFGLAITLPAAAAIIGGVTAAPGMLAAALLLLLAGDAGSFILAAAGFAAVVRVPAAQMAGLVALSAGLVLLAASHPDFSALRLAPPSGWTALIGAALSLAGGASMLGFGGMTGVALAVYVPARLLLDLAGPATPLWWGGPVLLLGAGIAVFSGLQALRAPDLAGVTAGAAGQAGGWMFAGLGTALIARGADLPPLAGFATSGALLQLVAAVLAIAIASVSVAAVERGAGTQRLDGLGGLARSMPITAVSLLLAGANLAVIPMTAGFAAAWMTLQAIFSGARIGGWPLQLCFGAAVLALAAASALAMAAMVRLAGVAFLGRPRTPRAAAAEDAKGAQRSALAVLSGVLAIIGILPAAGLQLANPALPVITRAAPDAVPSLAALAVQHGAPGYSPSVLLALGIAGILLAILATSRTSSPELVAPWEDGFTAPPPWMPFGDPATQVSPATLALGVPRVRIPAWPLPGWPSWQRVAAVPPQAALLVLAVVALLAGLI